MDNVWFRSYVSGIREATGHRMDDSDITYSHTAVWAGADNVFPREIQKLCCRVICITGCLELFAGKFQSKTSLLPCDFRELKY